MWAGIRPAKSCSTHQQDCQRHTTLSHCSLQKEKIILSHLQSKLQSCSLQSRILKLYTHTMEIPINIEICSWAMLRACSAQAWGVTHADTQGQNQVLRCGHSGSDVNLLSVSYLQVRLRATLQKWNYPGAGVHEENTRLPQLLLCIQGWDELVRSSAKHSAGIKLWLWGEVHRRTLSGMAEYLSLAAGWVNELHPATPVTRCMHLCQPFRGSDTDNATLMVLWNTFIKIPGKLRGVFPMSLLLRWAGIIYQLTKGWWNLLVSVPL